MSKPMPAPVDPRCAYELLSRMQADYRNQDLFESCCEDDPTIENRYILLQNALSQIGSDTSCFPEPNFTSPAQENDSTADAQPEAGASKATQSPVQPTAAPAIQHPMTIWDYRSNLLKLYLLGKLALTSSAFQADLTQTQQQVESFGNRHRKRKHLSAAELLQQEQGKVLIHFGTRVMNALLLFRQNPVSSRLAMDDLKTEIYETANMHNEMNLRRIRKIAQQHYFDLRKKYSR